MPDQLEAHYHGNLSEPGLNIWFDMTRTCPSVPFDIYSLHRSRVVHPSGEPLPMQYEHASPAPFDIPNGGVLTVLVQPSMRLFRCQESNGCLSSSVASTAR